MHADFLTFESDCRSTHFSRTLVHANQVIQSYYNGCLLRGVLAACRNVFAAKILLDLARGIESQLPETAVACQPEQCQTTRISHVWIGPLEPIESPCRAQPLNQIVFGKAMNRTPTSEVPEWPLSMCLCVTWYISATHDAMRNCFSYDTQQVSSTSMACCYSAQGSCHGS